MVSNKTSFGKVENTAAYVGKRKQAQKATYGQQKKQVSTSVKLRQHTLEKTSKLKKQRMDSNKTSFGKVEIAAAYVGKRKQAQKATYG